MTEVCLGYSIQAVSELCVRELLLDCVFKLRCLIVQYNRV